MVFPQLPISLLPSRLTQGLLVLGCAWLGVLGSCSEAAAQTSPTETEPQVKTVVAEFKTKQGNVSCTGEVITEYPDGSMLLLANDGQLWTLRGEDIISSEPTTEAMIPATSDEIYEKFRTELPPGFSVHKTRHYVLVYNTSLVYVTWVGQLFEGLHRKFTNYWKSKGIRLEEPRFPLVAVVFSNKQSYLQYAQNDIGESAKAMIGYYNMKTNRMITYDMTGVDGLVPNGRQVSSTAVIEQVLSQPGAERTVATIVHEAVHQMSFNSGLQVRLADNPYWVSEGMAMFFEAPDPKSRVGWGAIGKINYHNLNRFRRDLPSRSSEQFIQMITDDTKFQNAQTAGKFYPESWALTYYLLKTKGRQYAAYVKALSDLEPLGESTARERLELFQEHFGDPKEIESDYIKYVTRLR